MRRLLVATAAAALLLTGCADGTATGGAGAGTTSQGGTAQAVRDGLLAEYGLDGMSAAQIIDRLDRLGGSDRPTDLTASVRPDQLELSAGDDQLRLPLPEDRFYLSVAPYVDQTHDCFYHSLTTCTGELSGRDIRVQVVDGDGSVLLDDTRTTFANGFVGLWLPRDITGTLRVSYDGKVGRTGFSTGPKAATCLTTLRLA